MIFGLSSQPGFTRALSAVRSAEIGLLRAVALDLVSLGNGDAVADLAPEAIDVLRKATGSTAVTLQAHAAAGGGAVSFLGKVRAGIVVSAHLSFVSDDGHGLLRASIRLVGTHGSLLVDLLHPALDVRTATGMRRASYGVSSVPSLVDGDEAPQALRAIAQSARSGRTVETNW